MNYYMAERLQAKIPRSAAARLPACVHMPAEMLMIGQPSAAEGLALFPTGYFASRHQAVDRVSRPD